MTVWKHEFTIIVEISKQNAANNMAAQWDPDIGGAETFNGMRLSATGNEPATHVACRTRATDTMREGILQAFSVVPFAALHENTNFYDAIAAEGLQLIEPEP